MPAFASELYAELDGTGSVAVNQGVSNAPFTIRLSATGALECGSNATATVPTSFTLKADGSVVITGTSNPVTFTSTPDVNGNSNNCVVQGGGTVPANISVDAATPPGIYTVDILGAAVNSNKNGAKLEDKMAQSITVTVSEATPPTPTNHAPTVKSGALDAKGVEGQTLAARGAFADQDGDKLTLTADNTAGEFKDNGDGTWTWSLATNDDVDEATITVTANDGRNATAADSFAYSAANADPVLGELAMGGGNCSPTLDFTFTDPGRADTHEGTIDWGDGSTADSFETSPVVSSHSFVKAGEYTITVHVADDDAGVADAFSDHTVYNIPSGILQPINGTGRSAFKLGSTIPVKITVANCAGAPVTTLTPQVKLVKVDGVADGTEQEPVSTASPTSGTAMRWDAETQQYIYNLGTKTLSVGDWKVRIDDATFANPVEATFSLKK